MRKPRHISNCAATGGIPDVRLASTFKIKPGVVQAETTVSF